MRRAGRAAVDQRSARRSTARVAVAVVVSAMALGGTAGRAHAAPARTSAPSATAGAPTPPPAPSTAALAPAKGAIVVDADTGRVIAARAEHSRLLVASTSKILTALVVRRTVRPDAMVRISKRAEAMPARRLSLKAGQRWRAEDLLWAMMLCSCNDAAMALAEQAGGGSLSRFAALMRDEATRLGMTDSPVLVDPAGLDDEAASGGGNLISAHDLAVAARALLADPVLSRMVVTPTYSWVGGDGRQHEVSGHNRLLTGYVGAIGIKTGYTKRAGVSLVGAARRGGRTIIAVVVASPNIWAQGAAMLDQGFATPVGAQRRLPLLVPDRTTVAAGRASPRAVPGASGTGESAARPFGGLPPSARRGRGGTSTWDALRAGVAVVLLLVALVVLWDRHVVATRRRRRRAVVRSASGASGAAGPEGSRRDRVSA